MVTLRWDLSTIYRSFSDSDFQRDLERLAQGSSELLSWFDEKLSNGTDLNAEETLSIALERLNELGLLANRLHAFANLTLSANANDEVASRFLDVIRSKLVSLQMARVKLRRLLKGLELDFRAAQSPVVREHSFFLSEQRKLSEYLLSEQEERVLSLMRLTGANSWNTLFEKVTSNLLCELEVDGRKETLPLMKVRNMAYDPSPEIRKRAYEAELRACASVADVIAQCLNSIKGEFLTECSLRGYTSPLEPMLLENRISREVFDSMMKAVRESIPKLRTYLRKKATLLGHHGGLPWFDLFAPLGGFEKRWTFDEARTFIVEKLSVFSTELSNFVENAFESRWIDAETRPGKRGGAFCSSVKAIGESRILMSFDGTLDNVLTLAHELGHAFHNYCLRNETILNSSTPATLAETASIFNETLLLHAIKEETRDERQKLALLDKELSDAVQIIVDIHSRYLFESEVFKRRKDGPLSVEELKSVMTEAQRETYGDGLDESFLHPYMWVVKPHYYYPTFHFYNFPYTFGLLFGLGVFSKRHEEGFFERYKALLASTGKGTAEDVASMFGIDLRSEEFWRSSLALIEDLVDEFAATC